LLRGLIDLKGVLRGLVKWIEGWGEGWDGVEGGERKGEFERWEVGVLRRGMNSACQE